MARFKDSDWNLPSRPDGGCASWDAVKVAVLMDLRDELQKLNRVFACPNFQEVPHILRQIKRNTTKRRKPQGRKK